MFFDTRPSLSTAASRDPAAETAHSIARPQLSFRGGHSFASQVPFVPAGDTDEGVVPSGSVSTSGEDGNGAVFGAPIAAVPR